MSKFRILLGEVVNGERDGDTVCGESDGVFVGPRVGADVGLKVGSGMEHHVPPHTSQLPSF